MYELSAEDIEAIIYALGKLPTETNVYPLIVKIQAQSKLQLNEEALA